MGSAAGAAVRYGLQHPLGTADDRQEMLVPFVKFVASGQFGGLA